jgi:hypothetical protein
MQGDMQMCKLGVIGVILISASCFAAKDEFRVFTTQDDRVVSARIINVDRQRGVVELELENKRRKKVKPSVFTEADQAYIHDWNLCKTFMSSSGLRVEYVIYFEQSEESRKTPVVVQQTKKGSDEIGVLAAKKAKTISSLPVVIHKDSINRKDLIRGDDRIGGRGEVHGLRARFYMKTSNGKEIMREFSHPESLSVQKYPWAD